MEQLNLIWNLEIHKNLLRNLNKELSNLESTSMNKHTEQKLLNMENKLSILKSNHETIKRKLRLSEVKLKSYNYKIKEIENSLYNGETKDIRQLEYLSCEKDKLKEVINCTEIEILQFMEDIEEMDQELAMMDESLLLLKKENLKIKEQYKELKLELIKNISIEEVDIKLLEDKIENNLLMKYKKIRNSKGTGIAKVNNDTCSGCNMFIPTFLIDRLNNTKEIIYCESCGRILCKH